MGAGARSVFSLFVAIKVVVLKNPHQIYCFTKGISLLDLHIVLGLTGFLEKSLILEL